MADTTRYDAAVAESWRCPRVWLITGVAGFIGSNLLERLLALGQNVIGLDNFSTGHRRNLLDAFERAGACEARFRFVEGDTRDLETCRAVCSGVDYVLHHAALGSVLRSIDNPLTTHATNVDGCINMLVAARDAGVKRFVYASSSAVYGDDSELPRSEEQTGKPLSPYAVTKMANELYASVFQRAFGLETVGLRYFNVFGRRQDPEAPYAAVIPRWVRSLLSGQPCTIYGDGETSRDFCYIENAVQANILAATTSDVSVTDEVYNVGCGERTTLNELFRMIRVGLSGREPEVGQAAPVYEGSRPGDIHHSLADISRICGRLGYAPTHNVAEGLSETLEWYISAFSSIAASAAGGSEDESFLTTFSHMGHWGTGLTRQASPNANGH